MRFSPAWLAAGFVLSAAASSTDSVHNKRASNSASFQWLGVNESGAEFGGQVLPGELGKDYIFPNNTAMDILISRGINLFRVPILMERMVPPPSMTGAINTTYLSELSNTISHLTSAGVYTVIDSHNYGRYNGAIFTSTSDFKTYWNKVAQVYAQNSKVIFDCNNEFHDEPSTQLVADLNQACIDGIRAAGATSQYIFVEGTSYTGASSWITSGNAAAMVSLKDPMNRVVYEMHQYLDEDGSGTHAECVNSTIGSQRVAAATTWLRENKKLGIIGEFAGGNNTLCEQAVSNLLETLLANSDVWLGAAWWGGGPWWGDYIFGMEPPSGNGFVAYINTLASFAPGGAGKTAELGRVGVSDKGNSTGSNSTTGTPTATPTPVQVTGGAVSEVIAGWKLVAVVGFSFAMAPIAMLL